MKRLLYLLTLCLWLPASAQLNITSLKVDHLTSPEGLTDEKPVFSWILEAPAGARAQKQSAYELMVYEGNKRIWSTGKVLSENSIAVEYEGESLKSSTRYHWQVRVWDGEDRVSKWSERATWLTGMFSNEEWVAQWIEPQEQGDASPILRGEFRPRKSIRSAVAHITAHGLYEAYINGKRVGDAMLTPGWTTYHKRLQYQTYDVTSLLQGGTNAFGIKLGRGWYMSVLGWAADSGRTTYKEKMMGALAQIVVTYADGSKEIFSTNKDWKYSTGEITSSTIYDGESVDACKVQKGWSSVGFDDSAWKAVKVASHDKSYLVSCESEHVKIDRLLSPVKVITTPKGEKVLDFGQNLVGTEIFTYKGTPGQKITISHAEVLDEKGNFYTTNLRSAKAQSEYICSGEEDTFSATFTFYGFRYLKVEGIEGELNPDNFKAAVIFSAMPENGNFSSSNELVNQLQSNIQWGLMGNFVDVPTDCPQRDERLGWTGDAQNFFRTATFNRDVQNFFRKWLKDLALDQHPNGSVTDIVPNIVGLVGDGHVGWADAATIIPWQHYMAYGDKRILKNQYPSMKAWCDYVTSQSPDHLWNKGWHYGDWLFYSVDNDNAGTSAVSYLPLLQQCYYAHTADLVAKAAKALGYGDDAERYAELSSKIKKAFCDNYLTKTGFLVSPTQTAYILALNFDMVPAEIRPKLAEHLAERVNAYGHITTGFLGTPHINHALTANGYNDLAYKLLLRKQYPGWLYPVTMGATTIWERWNSMMPDRTIPDNGMNSFNHYSYGAIGDWLYRDAVGLHETSPGFKTIAVKPHPGGGFTMMRAEQNTPYGRAAAEWNDSKEHFSLEVTIPVNTTAEIYIPSQAIEQVSLDGEKLNDVEIVKTTGNVDGYTRVEVGSGHYKFEVNK